MHHPTNGITVTGEGSVTAPPDIAQLTLGVSTLRDTVAHARESAAASLQSIIDALRGAGITDSDMQTQRMTVSPEFDYDRGKQRARGFRATNALAVTVRDLDHVSEVIDNALAAGGDAALLQGIEFSVDRPHQLEERARTAAVADARRKAETLAGAAGLALGAAVNIVESDPGVPGPRPMMAMRAETAPTPTPVAPGQVEVFVKVDVTWAIV
jgi:uncharacterized protein YggE